MKKILLLTIPALSFAGPSDKLMLIAEHGYAYAKVHNMADNPVMIIVDFSLPSSSKRLWLYDIEQHKVLLASYVAHGKGTGLNNAIKFSDNKKSHQSSLGFYKVLNTYQGKHGLSLKLDGLEPTNKSALARGIVIHAANYVTSDYVNKNNRTGRSWGCFAVPANIEKIIIDKTHDHSLLVAYYPDQKWLNSSKFINS